jgi:hypothetical protein
VKICNIFHAVITPLPTLSGQGKRGEGTGDYIMTLGVAKTKYEHIVMDEKEVPIVAGTNMKIIELVQEKTA